MSELGLRAERLLAAFRDQDNDSVGRDGAWMNAYYLSGIGRKTCDELVKAGILKERPRGPWSGYGALWYRFATAEAEPTPGDEDFGDLWVEG
jgi:hypothetical protein